MSRPRFAALRLAACRCDRRPLRAEAAAIAAYEERAKMALVFLTP